MIHPWKVIVYYVCLLWLNGQHSLCFGGPSNLGYWVLTCFHNLRPRRISTLRWSRGDGNTDFCDCNAILNIRWAERLMGVQLVQRGAQGMLQRSASPNRSVCRLKQVHTPGASIVFSSCHNVRENRIDKRRRRLPQVGALHRMTRSLACGTSG